MAREWIASDAVAGATAGGDGFGNANDALSGGGGGGAIIARIAAIQIGGLVLGTAGPGDYFGIVAEQIGSFRTLGFTAPLVAATTLQVIELSPSSPPP